MTKEEIFAAWSPEDSVWAAWAKPVLFAHMPATSAPVPNLETACDIDWAPGVDEKAGLVLDLPSDEAVWLGVRLVNRGYRPIPLFNALPVPSGGPIRDPEVQRSIAAVNVLPIVSALQQCAEQLAHTRIPSDAPPAFLLDENRHGNNAKVLPDQFDNRSICFTTDFPSANFLIARGIQRVLLVQRQRTEAQLDLAHVLCRWQEGGLTLERLRIEQPATRERFEVKRPSWFGAMFQRALAALGLHRAAGGGFGAWMPESPTAG